ncbi:MAG: hypothetical protein KA207_02820 [Burkholderiaceae bacterium]|nr:hypothetical protein [Burkholderiaceae bacterium]
MNPSSFYDNTTFSQPTPPPGPVHTAETNMAERLFGATTPNPQPSAPSSDKRDFDTLTDQEKGQRLYGGTDPTLTFKDATQAIFNAGLEDHLHSPETAQEIAAEWAQTFAQYELTGTQAKEFADIGAQVMREAPTPTLVAQWTETAVAELKSTYGVQGAGQALQDARSYIAMRDDLRDLLDSLGLGSHPAVVRAAAERGRQLRMQGKL